MNGVTLITIPVGDWQPFRVKAWRFLVFAPCGQVIATRKCTPDHILDEVACNMADELGFAPTAILVRSNEQAELN